jgi:hypothetical protein
MYRIACRAGGIATVAAALLMIAAPPSSATFPAPDGKANIVQRVEVPVPVPVDDTSAEAVQMIVSIALGAAVATLANRRRRNRTGGSAHAVAWVEPPPVDRSSVLTTDVLSD